MQSRKVGHFLLLAIFIGPRSLGPIYGSKFEIHCRNLTDVALADKDTNTILIDKVNRTIQDNVVMQVTQPGGQLWNQCTL